MPAHSHHNEQLTYVLEGALRFWLGDDGRDEVVVYGGEVLVLPPNGGERLQHIIEAQAQS